jgi:hypothetical protein
VDRVDVHFTEIHGPEVPRGEPGHCPELYAGRLGGSGCGWNNAGLRCAQRALHGVLSAKGRASARVRAAPRWAGRRAIPAHR